jgi:UDP-2,4-diacetamido-2,4,6-trideoxy-beta-L-altropyranose hydrolase
VSVKAFSVTALPPPTASDIAHKAAGDDYAQWLGVPQAQDAAETLNALDGSPPDWLVVDHYGLDAAWEIVLRPQVGRILVLDDLANRPHDCDLLLDQNYAIDAAERYRGLVPAHARLLLGPRYALLHPAYAQYRRTLRPRDCSVRRVLVFFGGTDPYNLTGIALEALSTPTLADLAVDVVVGANNPHRERVSDQAAARPGTRVHGPRPHLADLMAAADLGLGAGGTTTWERCCLGLPTIVVSIAENQRPACEALAEDGLIVYAGHWTGVTADALRDAITQLLRTPERLLALSTASRRSVHGEGTGCVVSVLEEGTGR